MLPEPGSLIGPSHGLYDDFDSPSTKSIIVPLLHLPAPYPTSTGCREVPGRIFHRDLQILLMPDLSNFYFVKIKTVLIS